MNAKAFTTAYNGLSNRLVSPIVFINEGKEYKTEAIWDTGATSTCINSKIVEELDLIPIDRAIIKTASNSVTAKVYELDIVLPNNVVIPNKRVTEIPCEDILVGMDIISLGDFAVSSFDGKTFFSFVTPSQKHIDFVAQLQANAKIGKPHGKGKRKK